LEGRAGGKSKKKGKIDSDEGGMIEAPEEIEREAPEGHREGRKEGRHHLVSSFRSFCRPRIPAWLNTGCFGGEEVKEVKERRKWGWGGRNERKRAEG
jgi:hypothetical protein